MPVQSVRFDRRQWSEAAALAWLKKHHYVPIKHVDKTQHQLRYRIADPARFKRMVAFTPKTKSGARSTKGVSFVLGY